MRKEDKKYYRSSNKKGKWEDNLFKMEKPMSLN